MIARSLIVSLILLLTHQNMFSCPTCCAFDDQYVAPFFSDERYVHEKNKNKKANNKTTMQHDDPLDDTIDIALPQGEAHEEPSFDLATTSTQQ